MSTQQRSALDRAAPLVGRPVVWQPSPDGGIGKLTAPLGVCVYQKNDDRSKVAVGSSDAQDFVETVLHTATISGGLCGPNSRIHIYHNWRYTSGAASTKKGRCQVFYAAHAKLETVYETAG